MTEIVVALVLALVLLVVVVTVLLRSIRMPQPSEATRRAQNVAYFEGRRQELIDEQRRGLLSVDNVEPINIELNRDLLAEEAAMPAIGLSEQTQDRFISARLFMALVLLMVVIVPVVIYGFRADSQQALQWQITQSSLEPLIVQALDQGEFSQAISEFSLGDVSMALQAKLQSQPDSAVGWGLLAELFSQSGEYGLADQALTHGLRVNPADQNMLVAKALNIVNSNDGQASAESEQLVEEILLFYPNHQGVLMMSAGSLMKAERFGEAVSRWQQLLNTVPSESPARAMVQKALDRAVEGAQQQSDTVE